MGFHLIFHFLATLGGSLVGFKSQKGLICKLGNLTEYQFGQSSGNMVNLGAQGPANLSFNFHREVPILWDVIFLSIIVVHSEPIFTHCLQKSCC
jgi:hypothetical protein